MNKKINADDFTIARPNTKDFKQSVISRSNLTNQFTLQSLEDHQKELTKSGETIAAQIKLTDAVIGNVVRNYPKIAKLTQEELATASYLFENFQLKANSEAKLKEVKTTIKKYNDTLSIIYTKFGFVESNILEDEKAG